MTAPLGPNWTVTYHRPDIALDVEVRDTLQSLKNSDVILGIITDGRSITQRNKIKTLGLYDFVESDNIIISDEFGSEKPDERNYRYFMDKYSDYDFVYVGDNPKKDFIAPNLLGWETVMLLDDGRNIHHQNSEDELYTGNMAKHSINDITQLSSLLNTEDDDKNKGVCRSRRPKPYG